MNYSIMQRPDASRRAASFSPAVRLGVVEFTKT